MNWKYLFSAVLLMPTIASAAIPYRVEQAQYKSADAMAANYNREFADRYPFYVAAAYNFSMWDNYTDKNNVVATGKNTSSFDVSVGYRVYDTFRVELKYIHTDAEWDAFSLTGNGGMINAIFDARIDSMYRLFHSQHIVPYVGVGAGMTWTHEHNVNAHNTANPMIAAMAGVSFEFGGWWAFDLGYKYVFMFSPEFDVIDDLNPTAHQFRAGARFSF